MFTTKDLMSLSWFTVYTAKPKELYELKSNPTGHYWKLIYEQGAYTIMHKHREEDKYHFQTIIGSLYDGILIIVSHDEYQMRGRKVISVEEEKRRGSYFFTLIDQYGVTA